MNIRFLNILGLVISRLLILVALSVCQFLPLQAASLEDLGYTTTNGKVTITDCDEAATGELVIPPTVKDNPVTSIGELAFGNCFSLTKITIPDSVASIGDSAFLSCFSLTNIRIGNAVSTIGESAFVDCFSLTSITFQGAAPTVPPDVFSGVADGAVAYVTREALSSFGAIDTYWNGLLIQVKDGITNPAPLPEMRTAIEFSFNAVDGASYRIEASTDLINWEMIETSIMGEGSRIDRFYTTRNQPNRHFRVKIN
ncbi:MAG: leucine-rich repeat domain-containing protein [Akkermansiaceae bacterium]|nr:leucine-rich repeat domain-containing protein [Akkermansiaceae bacterium]